MSGFVKDKGIIASEAGLRYWPAVLLCSGTKKGVLAASLWAHMYLNNIRGGLPRPFAHDSNQSSPQALLHLHSSFAFFQAMSAPLGFSLHSSQAGQMVYPVTSRERCSREKK